MCVNTYTVATECNWDKIIQISSSKFIMILQTCYLVWNC